MECSTEIQISAEEQEPLDAARMRGATPGTMKWASYLMEHSWLYSKLCFHEIFLPFSYWHSNAAGTIEDATAQNSCLGLKYCCWAKAKANSKMAQTLFSSLNSELLRLAWARQQCFEPSKSSESRLIAKIPCHCKFYCPNESIWSKVRFRCWILAFLRFKEGVSYY